MREVFRSTFEEHDPTMVSLHALEQVEKTDIMLDAQRPRDVFRDTVTGDLYVHIIDKPGSKALGQWAIAMMVRGILPICEMVPIKHPQTGALLLVSRVMDLKKISSEKEGDIKIVCWILGAVFNDFDRDFVGNTVGSKQHIDHNFIRDPNGNFATFDIGNAATYWLENFKVIPRQLAKEAHMSRDELQRLFSVLDALEKVAGDGQFFEKIFTRIHEFYPSAKMGDLFTGGTHFTPRDLQVRIKDRCSSLRSALLSQHPLYAMRRAISGTFGKKAT